MAVTVTVVQTGANTHTAEVEATADADTTATIPHGLGIKPTIVTVTGMIDQAAAALSGWVVTTINATNIILTKSVAVGSGAAGVQVRMTTSLPHSLFR